VTPIFFVIAGSTSTSIFTGSKQAVTMAIASGLASVFSWSATLASLHEAPNTTNTGRLLMTAAAFACSSDECQGTAACATVAQHVADRRATKAMETMRRAAWKVRRHMAMWPLGQERWKTTNTAEASGHCQFHQWISACPVA